MCTLHTTQCTVTTSTHYTPDTILQITCCPQQPRPASTLDTRLAGTSCGAHSWRPEPGPAPHNSPQSGPAPPTLQHSISLTIPPPASHSLFSFLSEIGRPTPGVRNQLLIYSHLRGLIVSTWKICQTSFLSFWHCLNKCATNMLNIHFSKSTRTQLTGNDLNISRVNNIHGTCDTSVTVSEHSPCSHYILEYN